VDSRLRGKDARHLNGSAAARAKVEKLIDAKALDIAE
jgi:hypothetical protein